MSSDDIYQLRLRFEAGDVSGEEIWGRYILERTARDKLAERVLRLEKALTDIVRRCECICDQGRVCATCIAQLALQAEGEGK